MRILFAGALLCSLSLAGCDALDTKEDLNLTDEMMATRRYQMFDWGYRVYEHIPYGFTAIDGNLFAAVSDEAQYVTTFSSTQRFNEGSWSAYYNPDDCYTSYYNGIYAAHDYLDKSVDYRYILGMHRDTLTSNGLDSYRRDIVDVQRLRAEAHVLKAYYYFELAKRYGGVPLIDRVYADQKEANLPRGTFDEVVGLILREIEGVRNELVVDWRAGVKNSPPDLPALDSRRSRAGSPAARRWPSSRGCCSMPPARSSIPRAKSPSGLPLPLRPSK